MPNDRLYDPPKVGGDVLDSCSRCKVDLAHVIVSMVSGRPARVMCKTCKSLHNYRLGNRVASRTSSRPSAPRVARVTVRAADYWDEKMATKKNMPAVPYSPKATFSLGQVIQHPNFGLGFVEEVKLASKIVVMFRQGEKILIHSMS